MINDYLAEQSHSYHCMLTYWFCCAVPSSSETLKRQRTQLRNMCRALSGPIKTKAKVVVMGMFIHSFNLSSKWIVFLGLGGEQHQRAWNWVDTNSFDIFTSFLFHVISPIVNTNRLKMIIPDLVRSSANSYLNYSKLQ